MQKEGITPLMITLLLVSFAVAVGVVVMNLGSAEVEEVAECAMDIEMRFSQIAGEEQVCYDAAQKVFSFTVENGVNIDVQGIVVNVIGTESAETFELNEATIGRAGVYLGRVPFSGEIRQVKISPKIVPYDEEIVCQEQAVIVESVKPC